MTDPSLSVRPHAFPAAGGDAVRTTRTAGNLSWTGLLARLVDGDDLSAAEARWAMREVALGNVEQAQMAGFLVALRCKGESPQELLGFLDALMQDVVPIPIDGHGLLDLVGTGGDGAHTVNVSTMAAIVAAGSGARVLKHGGRSASSKAGAADVLEVLGLPLDLSSDPPANSGNGSRLYEDFSRWLRVCASCRAPFSGLSVFPGRDRGSVCPGGRGGADRSGLVRPRRRAARCLRRGGSRCRRFSSTGWSTRARGASVRAGGG